MKHETGPWSIGGSQSRASIRDTIADEAGLDAEDLTRQLITLRVGVNRSSEDGPFPSVLLQACTDDILALVEAGPFFVRDKMRGDFVIVSYERYMEFGSSS
ncbi:hypothetical protein [uncultured Tateyamaria sp.]|uniref:hypothetical protein n=1 Tax=uncultured Tateyamaria sp. TaxID=455651 RepID=UPI0026158266|nr:hypothetical protein [uncultured Tateyamaria sp.]